MSGASARRREALSAAAQPLFPFAAMTCRAVVFKWKHLGARRNDEWLVVHESGSVQFRRRTMKRKTIAWCRPHGSAMWGADGETLELRNFHCCGDDVPRHLQGDLAFTWDPADEVWYDSEMQRALTLIGVYHIEVEVTVHPPALLHNGSHGTPAVPLPLADAPCQVEPPRRWPGPVAIRQVCWPSRTARLRRCLRCLMMVLCA